MEVQVALVEPPRTPKSFGDIWTEMQEWAKLYPEIALSAGESITFKHGDKTYQVRPMRHLD